MFFFPEKNILYEKVMSCIGLWDCYVSRFLFVDERSFAGVDVCAVSVPVSVNYARQHGVYKISSEVNQPNISYWLLLKVENIPTRYC